MPGAVSLLERGEALETLLALAATSASQRGQLAVIAGEAGIGKSTLVTAFAEALESERTVAWGHCDDLFTPRELGPFHDMAGQLGAAVSDALAAGCAPAALFPKVLSALDALPDGSLLIFEDVHWADTASLDLLKFIARRLVPLRVMLVLTYRPDEMSRSAPLATLLGDLPAQVTTRLPLAPLSPGAVAAMAAGHRRDGAELFRATAGNPFFLSEILAQPAGESELPGSVRDAVLARAARAGERERELLDALCVAPDPVSLAVVERLQGKEGLAACGALEERRLLLRNREGDVHFRHELARLAILDALPAPARDEHQRRLLEVYLSLGDTVKPDLIVHHAAAIGNAEVLLEYAPRAAARAAALGACKEAAAQLAIALQHVDAAEPAVAARLYED